MAEFTIDLSPGDLERIAALAKQRGVDANTVISQAIGTEKLIADTVGIKDELLVRRGDDTFQKFNFEHPTEG